MRLLAVSIAIGIVLLTQTTSGALRFSPGIILGQRPAFDQNHDIYIKGFRTTLHLGALPFPVRKSVAVWPGLITEGGDLVQSCAFSDWGHPGCKNPGTKWCLRSATMDCPPSLALNADCGEGGKDAVMHWGKGMAEVGPGTAVDIEYKYHEPTGHWLQTMRVDGKVVSGLVTKSGKAYQLQIMTECQEDCYNNEIVMSGYRYTNTSVEFTDSKLTAYLNAFRISKNFTEVSPVKARDNAKTVFIDDILYKGFKWPGGGARPFLPGTEISINSPNNGLHA